MKKSINQRIALLAILALGAGFVTVSPASAAAPDITVDLSDSTGLCSAEDSSGFLPVLATDTDFASELATPVTVTMAVGGTINLVDINATRGAAWTSGGYVSDSGSSNSAVLHSNYGRVSGGDADFTLTAVKVGTVTINGYATAAPFSAANTVASTATIDSVLTLKIVESCSATGYSSTYSQIAVLGEFDATPWTTDGDVLSYGAGSDAYINILGKNGYNAELPATTTWVASATGATVKIGTSTTIDDSTTTAGTLSAATTDADGDSISIRVTPLSKTAGGTAVVTISAEGVSVGTRTITFLPEATKINVVKVVTGVVGGEGAVLYTLSDAAGTSVPGGVTGLSTTYTNRVNSVTAIKDASINSESSTSTTINGVAATTVVGSTTKYGIAKFSCATGGGSGTTKVTMRHLQPVTEAYITADVDLKCAGGLDTYTVSTDKAAYKLGEIATVTISAKDSSGNAVNDFTTVTSTATVSAGGGTLVKAVDTTNDTFSGGVKTYQVQMTTAGSFNVVVNLAGTVTKSQTAAYTVTGGDASNTEVLKSIVALIASINKQIQALQKLILKR